MREGGCRQRQTKRSERNKTGVRELYTWYLTPGEPQRSYEEDPINFLMHKIWRCDNFFNINTECSVVAVLAHTHTHTHKITLFLLAKLGLDGKMVRVMAFTTLR